MAREHGGELYDLEQLSDDELRGLILQQLGEHPNVDPDWIEVDVRDGFVTLTGRVGTDREVHLAEQIIHDVIGIQKYSNELLVDELHRPDLPEAVDEEVAEENATDGLRPGTAEQQHSDTSAHLAEDLEAETYGTHDMGKAVEEGTPYIPPDRPTGEGYRSGEDH